MSYWIFKLKMLAHFTSNIKPDVLLLVFYTLLKTD